MRFWKLENRESLPEDDDPWGRESGKMYSCIIRAEDEAEARAIANGNARKEIVEHASKTVESNWGGMPIVKRTHGNAQAWLSEEYSTCEEITVEGPAGLIAADIFDY